MKGKKFEKGVVKMKWIKLNPNTRITEDERFIANRFWYQLEKVWYLEEYQHTERNGKKYYKAIYRTKYLKDLKKFAVNYVKNMEG